MFNQDSETLRACINNCDVSLEALNTELSRGTEQYSWYWQELPRFRLDLKGNAVLELKCEDCQNDIWVATRQLHKLSIAFPHLDICVRIIEQSANYLLVEAAFFLEQWVDDFDEHNSSVLLSNGEFFIRPMTSNDKIRLNPKTQQCLLSRMNSVDLQSTVKMNVRCPIEMAASLKATPWLLTHLVHEYLDMDSKEIQSEKSETVLVRLLFNRLLFAKIHWRSQENVERALVQAFCQLSQLNRASRSERFLKRFTDEVVESKQTPVQLASAEQCNRFMEEYRCPSPIEEPDLSWMDGVDVNYRTADLSTVDTAVNDFFAERGSGGAELPWELGKDCRPFHIDVDRVLEKLKNETLSDEESSDEGDEYTRTQGLLNMSDLLESAMGENSPVMPLLSSMGVNVENQKD